MSSSLQYELTVTPTLNGVPQSPIHVASGAAESSAPMGEVAVHMAAGESIVGDLAPDGLGFGLLATDECTVNLGDVPRLLRKSVGLSTPYVTGFFMPGIPSTPNPTLTVTAPADRGVDILLIGSVLGVSSGPPLLAPVSLYEVVELVANGGQTVFGNADAQSQVFTDIDIPIIGPGTIHDTHVEITENTCTMLAFMAICYDAINQLIATIPPGFTGPIPIPLTLAVPAGMHSIHWRLSTDVLEPPANLVRANGATLYP